MSSRAMSDLEKAYWFIHGGISLGREQAGIIGSQHPNIGNDDIVHLVSTFLADHWPLPVFAAVGNEPEVVGLDYSALTPD